ncbi:Oidioi.mRNA.OKI2018_I69.PAR.g11386.t1.cds [Oikopleura dioica]|uniref:Oidioi.mRNA.OKI2018_I69.PAR.g11386.t1.cds n=1 Tax=Oikopleura dioica TaxID=34765 RepID=A0ABN7RZH5_OIKDI|nr:Oidioi.mRNA.OKI2018_I69.PAR.g11386.t1.cds [Oikopleura dioica]
MKLLDYVALGAATAQTPGFRLNTDELSLDYGDSEYLNFFDLERGKKKKAAKYAAWLATSSQQYQSTTKKTTTTRRTTRPTTTTSTTTTTTSTTTTTTTRKTTTTKRTTRPYGGSSGSSGYSGSSGSSGSLTYSSSSGSSNDSGSNNSEFFDDRDQLLSMINHIISTEGGLPDLGRPATDFLNYGCWCNVLHDRDHARKAFGKSLDSLDLACQHWEQCLKCTQMDDTDCQPLLTDYSVLLGTQSSGSAYSPGSTATTSCDGNAEGCGKWACQCDARFAAQFVAAIREGDFDNANLHASNQWDQSAMCAWTGDYDTHDECCGEYPNRFPFATNFGQRACCHNKTYNTNDAMCCANGHISTTGSCSGGTTSSTEAPTTPTPEPTTQEPTTMAETIYTTTPGVTDTTESFPFETFTTEKDGGSNDGGSNDGYNNPYAPAEPTTCQATNLNIVFSVDISSSMESVREFWSWFRGFVGFFDSSKQKISINTFADDSDIVLDLAHHDVQHIMDTVENLRKQGASSSSESLLLKALKTSRVSLKGLEDENSVVIVFTDGWNTDAKTPVFHGEEAFKDGINMISVGIGEKLMKEYLYTIATGNQRNVYEVQLNELDSVTSSLQNQICSSTSQEVFDSSEAWTGARPDIIYAKDTIADYAQIFDKRGRLPNGYQDLNNEFLQWYRTEAQFGGGLMMRRLNMTMFSDF